MNGIVLNIQHILDSILKTLYKLSHLIPIFPFCFLDFSFCFLGRPSFNPKKLPRQILRRLESFFFFFWISFCFSEWVFVSNIINQTKYFNWCMLFLQKNNE